MQKAEVVAQISDNTGIERKEVLAVVEEFMNVVMKSNREGETVYLRGFGTFGLAKRAKKIGRNISKGTTMEIPAHVIPKFLPCKDFKSLVKTSHGA